MKLYAYEGMAEPFPILLRRREDPPSKDFPCIGTIEVSEPGKEKPKDIGELAKRYAHAFFEDWFCNPIPMKGHIEFEKEATEWIGTAICEYAAKEKMESAAPKKTVVKEAKLVSRKINIADGTAQIEYDFPSGSHDFKPPTYETEE